MNLQLNQKLEYLDIIKYGINSIGREAKISDIEEVFKGKVKVVDDLDNMEVWATNHAYLGQEHLCLSFEQDSFCGFIDFDLMPKDSSILLGEKDKKLVNFKAQIFTKSVLFRSLKFKKKYKEVFNYLKGNYGIPNNLEGFSEEKKKVFEEMTKLLHETFKSLGIDSKTSCVWYIDKGGIYCLISFYYFKGNSNVSPYLSFAISECLSFNENQKQGE